MSDEDKWRGFLFAPLAVVLGLVFLIVLIATWRRDRDPRSMPKGSADRKLRKGGGVLRYWQRLTPACSHRASPAGRR